MLSGSTTTAKEGTERWWCVVGVALDLTGMVFTRLTVTEFAGRRNGKRFWRCRCSCGEERLVAANSLRSRTVKSCGCLHAEAGRRRQLDLTGQRYGRLTALRPLPDGKWLCSCECGGEKSILSYDLRKGHSKSCGCLSRDLKKTHGMSHVPEYAIYKTAVARCRNPKHISYPQYGGRGINFLFSSPQELTAPNVGSSRYPE